MATRKDKAGAAGRTKQAPKPPKKAPPKGKATPAKPGRPRAPAGQGKAAQAAAQFLAEVKAETPNVTSESFAVAFNLPLDEVGRMKAFVVQFLKDFDHCAAALRMGYPEGSAADTGWRMLHNPYVQLRVDELVRKSETTSIVTAGQIVAGLLKEANKPDTVKNGCVMSNSPSRISAWKELAKIMGLLIPKEPEAAKVVRYVMHVPAPFDWERGARESQKQLKESVMIDV